MRLSSRELATRLDFLKIQIDAAEQRLEAIMKVSVEADLLRDTCPCSQGRSSTWVLMLEIGRVDRFPTAAHLASYAGLVPRVHSSGGHTRMGQVCGNVKIRNPEMGLCRDRQPGRDQPTPAQGAHVVRLYQRDQARQESSERRWSPWRATWPETAWWVLAKQGSLSRAAKLAIGSFVDARVSAFNVLAQRG